jgi:alpha-1,2-mannosyltransferase
VALVVLTMLFISERSWKHHYVTVVIPYTYLVGEFFSSRVGPRSRMLLVGSWALSFVLMLATSTEVGGIFAGGEGHEIAQGYGAFLWAGVVLYTMVAWRVWARRSETPALALPSGPGSSVPRSHLNLTSQSRPVITS